MMTKLNLMKSTLVAACTVLFSFNLSAQIVRNERLLSFEQPELPTGLSATKATLGISDRHYKDGTHSLRWTFEPGSVLTLQRDLKFEKKDPTGKDTYLSAFIVWVYNAKAQDTTIEFEFLKDGKKCTSFPFGINFTGWRAAWVCYERDMQGIPESGMNELRIIAPDVKGELFIDHLITASKVDARQQTADVQVPFVNKGTTNHWLVIYEHSLWKPEIALTPVSEEDRQDMQLMEKRFRDMLYTPSKLTEKEMEGIRKKYDFYGITYKNGVVSGLPIFMVRQAEAYERMYPNWDKGMFTKLGMEMSEYFNLMRRIAYAYNNASDAVTKDELKQKFLAMYDHITDQGVAYGSCWGNIHHYGYSMRGLYVAYFLMKDVLREAGKLNEAERTLRWYAITNEVYPKPTVNGIDIDTFNTQTQGRMASILIMEDTPEKLQYLRSFSRWIDYGCRPAPGLAGSFKKDGACFHHRNNYPAYAVGGLDGATNMIYLLSGTGFKVSEIAHETVKNALLTMRFYCNTKQWALSMSGRHPNGKGQLIPVQYATLALAGTPDGKQKYDPELAAAYLRLVSYTETPDKNAPDYLPKASTAYEQKLKQLFEAQGFRPEPNPQGNLALGYGCVSVQRRDNWAAVVRGHSRYLWAAEHYLNGNFGMKLHEHDKYNGSHRARKSYHFFNGTIVCLGTDIENTNEEFPTETTVFQLAATTPEMHDYWAAYKSDGQTYIDPNGVGYYLPKNSMKAAKYEKNFPQVTVGERNPKPTSGDWVSLVLEHGKAPKGASYEYAVLPRTDAVSLKAFAKKPSYKVLQQDRNAHIVRSLTDNLTSYVLFETPQALPEEGLLQKADTSCLVMIRENRDKLLLTVSQPDLALYRGSSDEAFDKDGKRIERSIYSRPWIDNDSGEIPVTVTLKGEWNVAETPYCKMISKDKQQTVLRFICRDAASFDVELKR